MKKNLLYLLFLLVSGMANAQIVNIPDVHFKQILLNNEPNNEVLSTAKNSSGEVIVIDANNDGEIQVAEALDVWDLSFYSSYELNSVEGIEAFTNLRKLEFYTFALTSANLSALVNLTELVVDSQRLTSINVSGLIHLEVLTCDGCGLTSLDVSGLISLRELSCKNNGFFEISLTTLNLTGATSLERIDCSGNSITSLNTTGLNSLTTLICNNNQLNNLVLGSATNLTDLLCNNNIITSLDLTGLTSLRFIDCSHNSLTTLDFSDNPNISRVSCTHNVLTDINLVNNPLIEILACNNNNLQQIDLSQASRLSSFNGANNLFFKLDFSSCRYLNDVNCSNNPIYNLNLKNGTGTLYTLLATSFLPEIFICIDEGDEDFFLDNVSNFGLSGIRTQFSTYCSFVPGGQYNVLSGNFKYDFQNNGCDVNDFPGSHLRLTIEDGQTVESTFSNLNGMYSFYPLQGDFVITPTYENDLFNITPTSVVVSFDTADNLTTQDFCLTANGVHPDIEVVIVPIGAARPGFDTTYKVVYKNKGNQTLSGDVVFTYNDDMLDYVYGSSEPSLTTAGLLTWSYTDLLPFETRVIHVTLNVNSPTETPPVNIDDVLNFTAAITPATGDETPEDNNFNLNEVVVGSFDPNDITCLEGATVNPDKIGEYLHYNINFENTGTVAATFIVIKDIIDAAKFDLNTLQILDASHAMETRVTGSKVEFIFDDINLGAAEKGNVTFKIKTLTTLAVNSAVTQQADIFFDYNWPIQTNEATTTFAILSVGEYAVDNSVKVYPNPASDILTISAKAEVKLVQLYDVQGRLLQSGSGSTLDISNRTTGIYFVKIMTDKGMKVEKLVRK